MKVIDLHCDTLHEMRLAKKRGEELDLGRNSLQIDLEKLEAGDYLLQCFALFNNLESGDDPLVGTMEMIERFQSFLQKYPGRIAQVKTMEDLERNRREGKISALLTVEEGECCKGNLDVLRVLYSLGVRIMTLTWNYENSLGYPNTVPEGHGTLGTPNGQGLKERGIEFLAEMEKLGILVDVSHLSDGGFWDVVRHTEKPFIASHSNARALCPHVRNLTDEMLRAIADRGGVTGINYFPFFLDVRRGEVDPVSSVKRMVDHMDYIRNLGGIGMLALGSDFDGISGEQELKDASCLPLLAQEMDRRGYREDEIEAVFYRNALRVLKEVL